MRLWANGVFGPAAGVVRLFPMPGHAGLSFGFDVSVADRVESLVLRLAPPGVRRRGSTDVLRQVPLLQALADYGEVPVPAVKWASVDHNPFETDAMIVERVAGRPYHMTDPSLSVGSDVLSVHQLLVAAVDALVKLHAFPWRSRLAGWEGPVTPNQEVLRWATVNAKSPEPSWRRVGEHVAEMLIRSSPDDPEPGLVHGDYHANNLVLGDDGRLRSVVDWELACIGPQALDLGWLVMWTDEACWADNFRSQLRVLNDPEFVIASYQEAGGAVPSGMRWYRALATYRFGVIAAFNTHLHRSGRRSDPFYESLEASIPTLFERSIELLS